MIEIDLQIKEKSLAFKNHYNFNRPILFYLVHKKYIYLTTFVIVDFKKGKCTYIETLTDENIKKIPEDIIGDSSHSSMCFDPEEGFFNFLALFPQKNKNSFRYIDLKDKKMRCFFPEDFGYKKGRFSETCSTDNDSWFVVSIDQQEGGTHHFRCSKDMSYIELINITPNARYSPHHTDYFDGKIFTTEFFDRRYNYNGNILRDDIELECCYNERFKNPSDAMMDKLCSEFVGVDSGKGEIKQIQGDDIITYETNLVPSHIEHDTEDNMFYVSSHNFITIRNNCRMLYIGPAAIHKFKYNGNLELISTFQDDKSFRFTAHKFFRNEGKPYLTTFGHPNRLLIIDAETMKLKYHLDIGDPILERQDDVKKFLNSYRNDIEDPLRISTMEISEDGKYGVFLTLDDINIINLETKEIESKPFYKDNDFVQKTYHSETL